MRHGGPVGVEDGSRTPASDARLRDPKLRFPAPLRQAQRARTVFFWLRLFVGLAVLGLIIRRIDLRAATLHPSPLLIVAIGGATGLLILSQAVAAFRWKLILNDDRLPWAYLVRLYMIGSFFGLFLPTSVGGDAVRAMATARSSERAGRAIASVLIDRGFGVVAMIAYAVLGFVLEPGSLAGLASESIGWKAPHLASIVLALAVGGVAVLLLSRSARVVSIWHDGWVIFADLARSPRRLGKVLGLALASQGSIVLLWYTLSRGMNLTLPSSMFLWAVPLVSLSALLPVTFAGLGIREGVWLVLLAGSAIPPANIVAFSLLYVVCNILVAITGGILFVSQGLKVEPGGRGQEQRALDVG